MDIFLSKIGARFTTYDKAIAEALSEENIEIYCHEILERIECGLCDALHYDSTYVKAEKCKCAFYGVTPQLTYWQSEKLWQEAVRKIELYLLSVGVDKNFIIIDDCKYTIEVNVNALRKVWEKANQ